MNRRVQFVVDKVLLTINYKRNKRNAMARKELEQFHDILFHYNPYEDIWYAFKRSDANDYFSDRANIKVLKGTSIKEIVSAISHGITID